MHKHQVFKKSSEYLQIKIRAILNQISTDELEQLYSLFFAADRIFVYGAGRSGLVARAFAIRLAHLGFQTFVIGETIGAPIRKGDLVFVVSGSGETIPTVMTAEIAKKLGAKVIVMTSQRSSRIIKFADLNLVLAAECTDGQQKTLAPLGTLFEASAWILLDNIVAELMGRKGETEESMRQRHATLE
jgi:6-phospho 3-hexuloisomerase